MVSPDTLGDPPADKVTPALLRGITEDLETAALDAPEALKRVWSGLCLARLLGLRLAPLDAKWRQRQVNAESVEHQLARDLGTSATFSDTVLALPGDTTPRPLDRNDAEDAVEALVGFSATARRRMLAAAAHASQWHDERVLRHDSLVMGELGAAWSGKRAGYRRET